MPFITCLFSLIERSISAWHILHKYTFTYHRDHRSWIAMHTLRYLPSCVSFWQHFLTIMSQAVTAPRSLACAWVQPVMCFVLWGSLAKVETSSSLGYYLTSYFFITSLSLTGFHPHVLMPARTWSLLLRAFVPLPYYGHNSR
jgi:hypothetical protein